MYEKCRNFDRLCTLFQSTSSQVSMLGFIRKLYSEYKEYAINLYRIYIANNMCRKRGAVFCIPYM